MAQIDNLNNITAQEILNSSIPPTVLDSFNESYTVDESIIQFYKENGYVKLEKTPQVWVDGVGSS